MSTVQQTIGATSSGTEIADDLQRLCCAETEGAFFDYVTESVGTICRLLRERDQLEAERDMWHARALAMFWRLPDDTICGDLRRDTDKALAMLKTR